MTEEEIGKRSNYNVYVISINIGVLVLYTIISKFADGGFVFDAFCIAFQFLGCVFTGIIVKRWIWVLTAFVVVLIGFSTCVNFLDMRM